jgi:hypothetical protein
MNSNGNEFSWMSYRVRAAGVEIGADGFGGLR